MSTVAEIQKAIGSLPAEMLEAAIVAKRFGVDALASDDLSELLASMDEAEREIDTGLGVTADQLRKAVRSSTSCRN